MRIFDADGATEEDLAIIENFARQLKAKHAVSECCAGCCHHESEVRRERLVEDEELNDYGCLNPAVDPEWCLDPHRDNIRGIYHSLGDDKHSPY